MSQPRVKIAAAVTLAALGGLAAVAISSQGNSSDAAAKQAPAEVRTQVVRRTVRVHREQPPAGRSDSAAAGLPPAQAVSAATQSSARSPIGTETSAATGEYEHETEHEVEQEHGDEDDGGDDGHQGRDRGRGDDD